METKPSIDHVVHAIDTLYRQPDPAGKENASKWLEQFQRSSHAWEICDKLLGLNRDAETNYFAAQTMRTKIQYQFSELPIQTHMMLMGSIINHLETLHASSKATVTQLCLALADLAAQSVQWKSPIKDILTRLSSNPKMMATTLEILMVLPEEASRDVMKVGANRREEFLSSLKAASPEVWQFMSKCHSDGQLDKKSQSKLYQAAGSWITLRSLPPQQVAQSPLFQSAFQCLLTDDTSIDLHDATTDCICNALYVCEDINGQLPLAEACFTYVAMLPKAFEKVTKEEDLDKEMNFARIFTEMGESFLPVIVSSPGQGPGNLNTLDMLISCAENPKYEVVEITFNFWYRFAEFIFKESTEHLKSIFFPYVQRLLAALCRHCAMEASHEGLLESSDEFYEFRLRLSELLQDVVFIVGSGHCFNQVLKGLSQNGLQWNVLEGSLFMMASIIRNLDSNEKAVGHMLQLIVSLPQDSHVAVRQSSLHLVGEASFWISEHHDCLDPAFQYLLNGLQIPQLSNCAAIALEKFCGQCNKHLSKHYDVLFQVCKAIDTLGIQHSSAVGIVKGTTEVLSHLPHDKIANNLRSLCSILYAPLRELISKAENGLIELKSADPTTTLDKLAAVFRDISPVIPSGTVHPCQTVVDEIWPTLSKIGSLYHRDERVMERYCRCLRYAIRCVGQGSIKLLQPLVSQIITLYNSSHHSCFLYLGSVLVDEYGAEETCQQGLISMLQAFSVPTFQLLSKANSLQNHPDTVDDFFRLCNRFLSKCPVTFLENPGIGTVHQLAIAAAVLDHRDANGAVMKFFTDFFKCATVHKVDGLCSAHTQQEKSDYQKRLQLVTSQLQTYGQLIVKGLIDACAGRIQVFMVPEVADVFWMLISVNRDLANQWLQQALASLPSQSATGTVPATPQQLSDFYSVTSSAQTQQVLWRAFRGFARLYR